MTRTSVQSNQSQNKVVKLCYGIRGPYHIIRNIGHGSYYVKKLNKPNSPELKFMI